MSAMAKPVLSFNGGGWRDQAACRHSDPELYFPAGSTGAALDQIEAAKTVCRACPVQGPCLQFALETNQEDGVWGGRDEKERRKLLRAWRESRPRRSDQPSAARGDAKTAFGRDGGAVDTTVTR